ncbi:hypothetical protein T09_5799 [Trichinella sp. T9]|nr:hypothetical protein T09_5799 [Trichinella sp. T9]
MTPLISSWQSFVVLSFHFLMGTWHLEVFRFSCYVAFPILVYFVAGNPDYFGPVSASVIFSLGTKLGFSRPEEVVDSNEDFRNWVREFRKSRSEQQRIEWELKRKELHNLENRSE